MPLTTAGIAAVETAVAETIYNRLSGQKFADWYSDKGKFGQHITGNWPVIPKDQILEDIKRMFLNE